MLVLIKRCCLEMGLFVCLLVVGGGCLDSFRFHSCLASPQQYQVQYDVYLRVTYTCYVKVSPVTDVLARTRVEEGSSPCMHTYIRRSGMRLQQPGQTSPRSSPHHQSTSSSCGCWLSSNSPSSNPRANAFGFAGCHTQELRRGTLLTAVSSVWGALLAS